MDYKENDLNDFALSSHDFGFMLNDEFTIFKKNVSTTRSITFTEIQALIQKTPSNPKTIEKALCSLENNSSYENFKYQEDFLTSGFGEYLVKSLQLQNKYLSILLKITTNLSANMSNRQYACELYKLKLINSLGDLINSLQINQSNISYFLSIVIILKNMSTHGIDVRNSIIDLIPLKKILEATVSDDFAHTAYFKLVCIFFCYLLTYNTYNYKFAKYFPLFRDLYLKNKNSRLGEINNVLSLFTYLPKIGDQNQNIGNNDTNDNDTFNNDGTIDFLKYFDNKDNNDKKKSIIDEIIDFIEDEKYDKIVIRVLYFTYLIIKNGDKYFSKVERKANYYINFLKSSSVVVVYYAANVVRYIMKHEPCYIPTEEFVPDEKKKETKEKMLDIARCLMINARKGNTKQKSLFLKALCTLTKNCSNDCLDELLKHSFVLFLTNFLDDEDESILLLLIKEIDFLSNKEMLISGTQNILNEFLSEGGMDSFQEYLADHKDSSITGQINELLNRVNQNYD
ncbi:hypothetical protein M9Y10_046076 [Tritrichomonas musculus]|uniref:Uncharacterized protein n=1 Tax=Tritrichomonas musculus TaxID=1915356 RepID=A0ABR2JXE4_9EUKA